MKENLKIIRAWECKLD